MKPSPWHIVVLAGAFIGLVFAGLSTSDFVQHLDRQVHSVHCSFIPGSGTQTDSGCHVAMLSSYSSVFRARVWGGVPISLPAMCVFAFILLFATDLLLTRRKHDPRATAFLVAACALPAAVSLIMLIISLSKLGTVCKLCVAIYIASAMCITGAIVMWRQAVSGAPQVGRAKGGSSALLEVGVEAPPASNQFLGMAFGIGVAFVVVPILLYLGLAPSHEKFIGTCEGLAHPEDTYGTMVKVERGGSGGAPTLEILDPMCPACKAFEERLQRSGYADRLDRKAILFPLDSTCNKMVNEVTHPGACAFSEAILCAGDKAPDVIAWAFEVQEQVKEAMKLNANAAGEMIKQKYPDLAACVGSPEARSKVNKSLRWAKNNAIRLLTPQIYIDNVKVCDEDVDLGLDYTLRRMLDRHDAHTLVVAKPAGGAP